MRVVVDVNVWISGLLWGGSPGQVLQLVYGQQIQSYVSTELLLELKNTLEREKFRDRLSLRNLSPTRAVTIAQSISELVAIPAIAIPQLRDPADLKIAATAIVAQAQCLITGDQDLLVLENIQGTLIATPSNLLEMLRIDPD
jgi:putative PIN family toxin of toxin-antitoxin system